MRSILFILTAWLGSYISVAQTVTDIDGNVYNTVTIGTQVWMSSNLQTTHFQNGDTIPSTSPCNTDIHLETQPVYQWAYNCNESLAPVYGRLYTWHVIADDRHVCPAGWHVPSLAEFYILRDYLGGAAVAGGKLKETGYDHWLSPNTGATNEVGFNGVPNGHRSLDGSFTGLQSVSDMWTTTEGSLGARDFDLNHDNAGVISYDDNKEFGFAIRCIKDDSAGIDETVNFSVVSFYPVPAQNSLWVVVNLNSAVNWEIYSLNGDLLLSGQLNDGTNELDIESLESGMYIIRFTSEEQTTIQKFTRI